MSSEDWYRNITWNEEVSEMFETKLKRARSQKQQYLRIQACVLADHQPEVALSLSDRYFEMGDNLDHAQAYADRATAYLALGSVDEAVDSFEKAIVREIERPGFRTNATCDLPFLIATMPLPDLYMRAIAILDESRGNSAFQIQAFKRCAAFALILPNVEDRRCASRFAQTALEAAAVEDSGLRFHKKVGLVGDRYSEVIDQLKRTAGDA